VPPLRVLLTGAAGPLGGAAAAALAGAGHTVRATDLAPPPAGAPLAFQAGPLTDPAFVARLLDGIDAVVHLAPLSLFEASPGELLDTAARGTHVLLKGALDAGIRLAVQASTLAIMDAYDQDYEVTEQWRPRPQPAPEQLAPYLAELVAREFTRDVQLEQPMSIICLRFDLRSVTAAEGGQAIVHALDALQRGTRQRGHRWQLYHIGGSAPGARYTSRAAREALRLAG
jgi:nucleoside-diphosphate-sugar epimerase